MEQNALQNHSEECGIKLSRVKISKDFSKKISKMMLESIKVDQYTKNIINERIIETDNYRYITLLKKHSSFFTSVRLMVLVDHLDILDAIKYYVHGLAQYSKDSSKKYNIITALQTAELKLIMFEYLFEHFENSINIGVVFHNNDEKVGAIVEIKDPFKIKMYDLDGCDYMATLTEGKYGFESRPCSSISDAKYILEHEKRKEYNDKYKKYFIFIPKDADILEKVHRELEQNNVKVIFSEYSTIDIVNDVAYMEGILSKSIEE